MADKKKRLNTDAMFQSMIGQNDAETTEPSSASTVDAEEKSFQKSPKASQKTKNVQVSVYLPPDMIKEIRMQDALKSKENDKSALVRAGLSIILGLTDDTYHHIKEEAKAKGVSIGKLAEDIFQSYFKK